jgi:hypothetical protein
MEFIKIIVYVLITERAINIAVSYFLTLKEKRKKMEFERALLELRKNQILIEKEILKSRIAICEIGNFSDYINELGSQLEKIKSEIKQI